MWLFKPTNNGEQENKFNRLNKDNLKINISIVYKCFQINTLIYKLAFNKLCLLKTPMFLLYLNQSNSLMSVTTEIKHGKPWVQDMSNYDTSPKRWQTSMFPTTNERYFILLAGRCSTQHIGMYHIQHQLLQTCMDSRHICPVSWTAIVHIHSIRFIGRESISSHAYGLIFEGDRFDGT